MDVFEWTRVVRKTLKLISGRLECLSPEELIKLCEKQGFWNSGECRIWHAVRIHWKLQCLPSLNLHFFSRCTQSGEAVWWFSSWWSKSTVAWRLQREQSKQCTKVTGTLVREMKQPRCWMSDLGPSKSNFGFGHWVNWGQVPVTRSLNCACGLHFSWREEVWVGWAWSRLPTRASCVDATRSKDGRQDNQAQWKNFAGALPWIRFTLNWSFVD